MILNNVYTPSGWIRAGKQAFGVYKDDMVIYFCLYNIIYINNNICNNIYFFI